MKKAKSIFSKSKKRKMSKSEKNWLESMKTNIGKIKNVDEFLKTVVTK